MHLYAPEVLRARKVDAIRTFAIVSRANAFRCEEHWQSMPSVARLLDNDGAARLQVLRGNVMDRWTAPGEFADVVMTSPPYGDNHTTVPYGQHSFLPLCWIDRKDLVGALDPNLLATAAAIDSRSLGGSRANVDEKRGALVEVAPSLEPFMKCVEEMPSFRAKVLNFVGDYAEALSAVSGRLRPGGFSFWTLGERRVNHVEMPLVAITRELLEACGNSAVTTLSRRLPTRKRIASRNKSGETMATEYILVMQKKDAS